MISIAYVSLARSVGVHAKEPFPSTESRPVAMVSTVCKAPGGPFLRTRVTGPVALDHGMMNSLLRVTVEYTTAVRRG